MKNTLIFATSLVSTLVLAGCASLPVAGPIRVGPDIASGNDANSFYYSPSTPLDGAAPDEILSGFLAAGTGPQNDYSIAREYLSESIRSSWNPSSEVLIQRSSPRLTLMEDNSAEVEIDVLARIDSDGKFQPEPVGTEVVLEYQLVEESGQWRISKAPDATVVIKPVFDVIFDSFSIYFLDRQQRHLVPDLRWFATTPATGTRLVNALLRGPSSWLKPAVISAIPSGTRLSIDAVTVEAGTALVDLTARALVAGRADRSLMKAQLAATLSQLSNVQQVAISIERSRQDIPDPQIPLLVEGSASLVALKGGTLNLVAGPSQSFSKDSASFFESIGAIDIAIGSSSGYLAALSETGIYRTELDQIGSTVELVDSRAGLLQPVFDKQQYLWSVSRARGSQVFATSSSGNRILVASSTLQNEVIRDFQISPEGSRLIVLVQGQDRNRVLLASIIRDNSGMPVAISETIEISPDTPAPIAISWVDNLTVALVSRADPFVSATLLTIGGTARSISLPESPRRLKSGGSNLHLLTDDGELYIYRGSSWSVIDSDVSAIAVAR